MADQNAHELLKKLRNALKLDSFHPFARKAIVGVLGSVCFTAGVAMIVLPGPAFVFVPLGLLLLATEFKWAERWAHKCYEGLGKLREKWRARKHRRANAASKP